MKTKILWIILIVLIIAIFIASYFIFLNKPGENSESAKRASDRVATENQEQNEFLSSACQNANVDYPQWTKEAGEVVVYEKSDKTFYFRNSPEEAAALINSPVKNSGTLIDMDFIDKNKFIYVVKDKDSKIGSFEFSLQGIKNEIIYEITKPISFADVSPINEKEFIIFYVNNNEALLKRINTEKSTEETITEISETNEARIALSPKATYVYLLQGNFLKVFELSTKELVYENNSTLSAVWLGDSYLLTSDSQETFIYDLKNHQKEKLSKITSASNLYFNPGNEGTIAYNSESESKIVKCQNWEIIGNLQSGEIETFASEKTAIVSQANSPTYWRFLNSDWTVKLADQVSIFATVWKRY